MADDPLDDFEPTLFTHDGTERVVFRKGEGPGVVVMAEIPGITPLVADFARRVVDLGCSVALPVLFGTPGQEPSVPYGLSSMTRACVSKEFHSLRTGERSPVTDWVRGLARDLHDRAGGPGVGAIGMCLTGGFALALMLDDEVIAPVLSQPSLPLPIGSVRKRDLGISDADLDRVKERVSEGVCVLGLRFSDDSFVPDERFERLDAELGDGFIRVDIDSGPDNDFGIGRRAHSVVTEDLVDEEGHPTQAALQQVLDFFAERLLPA